MPTILGNTTIHSESTTQRVTKARERADGPKAGARKILIEIHINYILHKN